MNNFLSGEIESKGEGWGEGQCQVTFFFVRYCNYMILRGNLQFFFCCIWIDFWTRQQYKQTIRIRMISWQCTSRIVQVTTSYTIILRGKYTFQKGGGEV